MSEQTETTTEKTGKRVQKPRDVDYTLEIVDDLPDLDVQRRSPLEDQIEKIVSEERSHGKFVRIGSYANGSAASAAANTLRKRHGDKAAVDGFDIRVRRADKDGEPRTGLFVRYDPSNIVAGAREDFEKRMQTKEDTLAKRREQAQTAKGNGESSASDSAASDADAQIAAAAEEANAAPKEGRTPRERKQGPGQTSGTAEAAKSKAPGAP
jgi:hypothetical protein